MEFLCGRVWLLDDTVTGVFNKFHNFINIILLNSNIVIKSKNALRCLVIRCRIYFSYNRLFKIRVTLIIIWQLRYSEIYLVCSIVTIFRTMLKKSLPNFLLKKKNLQAALKWILCFSILIKF